MNKPETTPPTYFHHLRDGTLSRTGSTPAHTGRLVFHILGSIAEMERELIRERTMAGLAAHRKAGGGGGRKSVLTPRKRDMAVKLLAAGDRPQDVAQAIGVSVSTFYRYFPASGRAAASSDDK